MMVKKKILTRKLTRQEAEVALACGAKDGVDFIGCKARYVGEDASDVGGWSEQTLRECGYIDYLWLFEEIEEDG